ncbi:hypothetical protein [Streptomyces sp. NPDC088350]|uniref:hypothetical protein n=1 Tax=Streptomyces sp. NPDC088350 TaxID=3365854 RepID=UPI003826BCE0
MDGFYGLYGFYGHYDVYGHYGHYDIYGDTTSLHGYRADEPVSAPQKSIRRGPVESTVPPLPRLPAQETHQRRTDQPGRSGHRQRRRPRDPGRHARPPTNAGRAADCGRHHFYEFYEFYEEASWVANEIPNRDTPYRKALITALDTADEQTTTPGAAQARLSPANAPILRATSQVSDLPLADSATCPGSSRLRVPYLPGLHLPKRHRKTPPIHKPQATDLGLLGEADGF